jgi:hypothetical protein
MRCRCYINAKTYAKLAARGSSLKGYKPCPLHEESETSSPGSPLAQGTSSPLRQAHGGTTSKAGSDSSCDGDVDRSV